MIKPTPSRPRTLLLLAALTFSAFSIVAPAAHAQGNPSASGHVTIFFPQFGNGVDARVSFTFAGVQHKDGTVSGNATLQSQTTTLHADITCVRIVGNLAYLSGPITKSDNPAAPAGQTLLIAAQDNGEGNNAPPDLVNAYSVPPGTDCSVPAPANVPVIKGNVEVNSGN